MPQTTVRLMEYEDGELVELDEEWYEPQDFDAWRVREDAIGIENREPIVFPGADDRCEVHGAAITGPGGKLHEMELDETVVVPGPSPITGKAHFSFQPGDLSVELD